MNEIFLGGSRVPFEIRATNGDTTIMLNILLFGSTGWIGGMFSKLLMERGHRVIPATSRLENLEDVAAEIQKVKPDRVVLAAGITGRPNVDWCEAHPDVTWTVNVTGTVALVKTCETLGIHITNFATGCIYEYDGSGKHFTEEDAPNFSGSAYSRSKAAAEASTRDCSNQLLLRVRMPITADGASRCFITKIASYRRVVSVPNSVSVLPSLLPLAAAMCERGDTGVYNFVNPCPVSHGEVLDAYIQHVCPTFAYEVMTQEEHDATSVVAKRSNVALCCDKLANKAIELGMGPLQPAVDAIVHLLKVNLPAYVRAVHEPKHIIVTGGAGFIGSNFVRHVRSVQPLVHIVVFDKLDASASLANVSDLPDVTVITGDVTDATAVKALLREHHPDTVVHFAAYTHVDASFDNPLAFTMNNVYGTQVLAMCMAEEVPRARLVHISTDEVYGDWPATAGAAASETSILVPTNPYAASKAAAEQYVHAHMHSYGLDAIIIRMNNVYGPRQFPEKLIPRFMLRAAAGLPLQIQGSGLQTRKWLHVSDACAAVWTAAVKGSTGRTFNVGAAVEASVLDVGAAIVDIAKANHCIAVDVEPSSLMVHVRDRLFNDQRYDVDDQRLRKLGWQPKITSLLRGLSATWDWYMSVDVAAVWPKADVAIHALDDQQ